MAWCHQATSHCLNQCWPSSMSPYGITTAQWVISSPPNASYMCQWISTALVQIMAYCLFGAKPLSEPILGYCQLPWIGPFRTNFSEILIKIQNFSFTKMHLKISSAKRWPFCPRMRWVNSLWPTDTKWHHSSLLIITCWLGTPRHYLG